MESNEDMVMIPRLNAQANLHIAILEAIQKMGYNQPSENQALAINHFIHGNVFISLPTGSGKSLCYASVPGVVGSLEMQTASDHHSVAIVVSPLSSLMLSFKLFKW